MRRAWLLLGCLVAVATATPGAASASCVDPRTVRLDAVADFDAHVVEVRDRGAVLSVERVRRGKVTAGDRVEVVDMHPDTSVSQPFALGERYRVFPTVERRPYGVNACLVDALPGRVEVTAGSPAFEEGEAIPWVAAGAALLVALAGGVVLVLRRRT